MASLAHRNPSHVENAPYPLESMRKLYASRKYVELYHASLKHIRILKSCQRPSKDHLRELRGIARACALNLDLAMNSDTCQADRLCRGWYETRIRKLLDAGALVPVSDSEIDTDQCVLVERRPQRQEPEIRSECTHFHRRDGGYERNTPSTVLLGFPMDQMTAGDLYVKTGIFPLRCPYPQGEYPPDDNSEDVSSSRCWSYPKCAKGQTLPRPKFLFPVWHIGGDEFDSVGGPYLDVFVAHEIVPAVDRAFLSAKLKSMDSLSIVRPAQFYETQIDPNVGAVNGTWVPTEFDVFADQEYIHGLLRFAFRKGTGGGFLPVDATKRIFEFCKSETPLAFGRCKIRSPIPDLDPHKHARLYGVIEDIFERALPMLARMRLPALLLPGPLQVVVKAQSIVLKDGERYEGVWHDDGLREDVVAVVLFYYNVTPTLSGGSLEFASKRKGLMGCGDYAGEHWTSPAGVRGLSRELQRCIVPVSNGTYVVFSNYAAVHRVLPIEAPSGGGSRDFLAFFVIDQKSPLPVPAELGPVEDRRHRRGLLLAEQLQERGRFGLDNSRVYSTGNGCLTEVAWLAAAGERLGHTRSLYGERGTEAAASRLNMAPPVVGRGASYIDDLDSYLGDQQLAEYCSESVWVQCVVAGSPNALFAHVRQRKIQAVPPEGGVSGIHCYESFTALREEGYWTPDKSLEAALGR